MSVSEAAHPLMPARVQATWRLSSRPQPTSTAATSRKAPAVAYAISSGPLGSSSSATSCCAKIIAATQPGA